MARAACIALTLGAKGSMLKRVFFLQPLMLDGDLSDLFVTVDITGADERFDVNTDHAEMGSKTSHCAGSQATFDDTLPSFSHAALRGSCERP
eukprot:scaffold38955_cov343-Isochrysis_galbana.AAC.1